MLCQPFLRRHIVTKEVAKRGWNERRIQEEDVVKDSSVFQESVCLEPGNVRDGAAEQAAE